MAQASSQARQQAQYIYRFSTMGKCLTDALDEMVSNNTLSKVQATEILDEFEKVRIVCDMITVIA